MASAKSGRGLSAGARSQTSIGASIVAQALGEGVLLNAPRPDTLRFMPALNVTRTKFQR